MITSNEAINNLKAFLVGGEDAPEYAPDGVLSMKHLSIEKFARASNVTRTAVYNYINNVNRPTLYTLRKMAEALEIPLDEILNYCTPAQHGRPKTKSL